MREKVFISYSSKEASTAYMIEEVLERNGIPCWMAPDSIAPGSDYAREIPRGINDCEILLLLLSEKAQTSPWVRREVDRAISLNKIIIPFMISKCDIGEAFEFMLSNVQRWNAYEAMSENLEKLVRQIQGIIGVEEKVPEASLPAEKKTAGEEEFLSEKAKERYRNLKKLETTGMSQVYKAFDEEENEAVVIKRYALETGFFCPIFGRYDLYHDLRDISKINGCKIIEIQRGENPYIVMKYLDGVTLYDVMQSGQIGIKKVLGMIRQILLALKELHKRDIFYGDATPNNIMIVGDNAYLCDYSCSDYNGAKFDNGATVILSGFSSPEKLTGDRRLDYRSDIFEVGALLDALTLNLYTEVWNEIPFWQKPDIELEMKKRFEKKCDANMLQREQSERLLSIISKAMKNSKEERYQSVDEFLEDLSEVM